MAAECTAPLASAIFGLLGVALGGYIGYLSAVKIGGRNARHVAAAKFRAAFAPAIAFVIAAERRRVAEYEVTGVAKVLFDSFSDHAAAVEEFRHFIASERMPSYQKAWDQYCDLEPTRWGGGAEFMAQAFNGEKPLKVIKLRLQAIMGHADA